MSGWDQARRVPLAEPWDEFWVDVNPDLPMGVWLDFKDAWERAKSSPVLETIEALIDQFARLVIRHNITDRDGEPLTFGFRTLTPKLVAAIGEAILTAQEGAGTAVDPFGNPAPSPEDSSPAPRSPSGSRSSGLPAGPRRSTSNSSPRRGRSSPSSSTFATS